MLAWQHHLLTFASVFIPFQLVHNVAHDFQLRETSRAATICTLNINDELGSDEASLTKAG
jgi:hypothetical protein